MTKFGFFSIVEKEEDKEAGMLTVRARVENDLNALREFIPNMGGVVTSTDSDYAYRVRVLKADFAEASSKIVMGINYPNFKDEVMKEQGIYRAVLYTDVWATLRSIQTPSGTKNF